MNLMVEVNNAVSKVYFVKNVHVKIKMKQYKNLKLDKMMYI